MGFDKEIDNISHRHALRWVLIRELVKYLNVMSCAMGFETGIKYISQSNALLLVLMKELIIFLIVMPCNGF